jgi:hypothetical protein
MKKLVLTCVVILYGHAAFAQTAPNRADTSQLGSVLGFPYVTAVAGMNTIIRLTNTNSAGVSVRCQYRDNVGNNVAATAPVGANATAIFNVSALASGGEGFMWCWAISGSNAVRWNYMHATATIVQTALPNQKWEYTAWSFAARQGTDGNPVPGNPANQINLDGVRFDQCAQYLFGQYSPETTAASNTITPYTAAFSGARFAAVQCHVDLRASLISITGPPQTSISLTMLTDQGVALTGLGVACVGTWHETALPTAAQIPNIKTMAYRVQSLGGAAGCSGLPARGLIGVQLSAVTADAMPTDKMGSSLTIVGQRTGQIRW